MFTAESRYVSGGLRACSGCAQRYTECAECGTLTRDTGCDECSSHGYVWNYSYKPDPRFLGVGPVFLGLELEIIVPTGDYHMSALTVSDHLGRIGYLKHDSSIQPLGFELVTHPMDYRFAIEEFPWHLLDRLVELGCTSDNKVGIHVHVSRDGFASPTHIYRWAKLIYRNEAQAVKLARRRTHFADFTARARRKVRHAAKDELRHYDLDRYQAINPHPRHTLELRIFAGSLDRQHVQAALAFVDASVEYTRGLTSADVLHDGGWEWARFVDWVSRHDKYAPLRAEMEALECAC
ncbi:amidoligase family protein [Nocardia sp. NPDC059246]|uniref:amidoligase family protein n=1 Tax=unclassified Nocardia TaxID=2637762 RepID=UPI0036C77406